MEGSRDELLDEELASTFDSTDDLDAEDPLLHVTSSGRDIRPAPTTPPTTPGYQDPEDDEGFFDTRIDSINARLDDLEAAEAAKPAALDEPAASSTTPSKPASSAAPPASSKPASTKPGTSTPASSVVPIASKPASPTTTTPGASKPAPSTTTPGASKPASPTPTPAASKPGASKPASPTTTPGASKPASSTTTPGASKPGPGGGEDPVAEAWADEHDALDTHNDALEGALDALEADAADGRIDGRVDVADADEDADDRPDVPATPPDWRDRVRAATTGTGAASASGAVDEAEFEPTLDALEDAPPDDLDRDLEAAVAGADDELVDDVWSDEPEGEAPSASSGRETRALPRSPSTSGPAWSRGRGPDARARADALGDELDGAGVHDEASEPASARELDRARREVARGLDAGERDGDDGDPEARRASLDAARRAAERVTRPLQALGATPDETPRGASPRHGAVAGRARDAAGRDAAGRDAAGSGERESATSRLRRKLDDARPRDPPPSRRLDPQEAARQVARALATPTREDIEVTLRRAHRTLERMEGLGFPTDDLEGRLGGAASMAAQGQLQAALVLCEEVLVLARTMIQADARGQPRDPLASRVASLFAALLGGDDFTQAVDSRTGAQFGELLGGDEFTQAVNARTGRVVAQILEDTLAGPTFQAAVGRLLERRLEAHVEEAAFADAVAALFERRIAQHLRGRDFAGAAARAAADAPQDLLDRPETIARIEAVATARDRALLGSSRFAERVRELLAEKLEATTRELTERLGASTRAQDAVLQDPRLAELVAKLVQPKLDGLLDTPAAQAALDARGATWLSSVAASPGVQDAIDGRARARAEEVMRGELFLADLDNRTRGLLGSEEFRLRFETLLRGTQVVHEVVDQRLGTSDALTRLVSEQLVERVSELVPRLVQPIVEAQLDRAKHDLLEDGAFSQRVDEVARRRAEGIVDTPGFRAAIDARGRALQDELSARLGREVESKLSAAAAQTAEKILESQLLRTKVDQAAARAVERQEKSLHDQLERAAEAHRGLERKLESLVPVLIKTALADGGSAGARLEQIAEAAAKRVLDEEWVVRIIRKEIANREALKAANISGGDGVTGDVGDAVRRMVADKLEEFRKSQLEERRQRRDARARPGARPSDEAPVADVRELRANRTTERRLVVDPEAAAPRARPRETDPEADTQVERAPRPPRPPGRPGDDDRRPPTRNDDDRPRPPRRPPG